MLIYEKKVHGTRHIYGTLNNVPSDSDEMVVYKDNAGNVIPGAEDFTFVYSKDGAMFANDSNRQIPTSNDTKVNVWLGDTLVIGNVVTRKLTHNTITHATVTLPNEAAEGASATLSVVAKSGYHFTTAPTATANGKAVTLTESSGTYTGTIVVGEEDIAVTVTATPVAD